MRIVFLYESSGTKKTRDTGHRAQGQSTGAEHRALGSGHNVLG